MVRQYDTALLLAAGMLVAVVAACGGQQNSQPTSVPLSACEAAVKSASEIDDMHDTVSDLDPAIRAYASLAELAAAALKYPSALDGVDAGIFVANRCEFEPTIATTLICKALGTPAQTARPTVNTSSGSYDTLTSRAWKKLVKAPDSYIGQTYKVWGCIAQFDAATGLDTFRASAWFKKTSTWFLDGENALFTGDASRLADFVEEDVFVANVMVLGSLNYDTQIGGNTTAPWFSVDKITHKGSC